MLSRTAYVDNLKRIYVAHDFYADASEGDKARVFEVCQPMFDKVTEGHENTGDSVSGSGFDRSFGVLLLLFGWSFLREEFGCDGLDDFVEKFVL